MESTRKRLLAIVFVGLWMSITTDALAWEETERTWADQPPASVEKPVVGPLTANVGLDVAVGSESDSPASGDAAVAESERLLRRAAEDTTIPNRRGASVVEGNQVAWYRSPYIALVVVLGLILAVAAMFKRYVPSVNPMASGAMKVVCRTPLGGKQAAVLLHVGKRLVLVGMSGDGMRTLSEITDEEEISLVMGKAVGTGQLAAGFKDKLARQFDQYTHSKKNPASEVEAEESVESESRSAAGEVLHQTKGRVQDLLSKIRSLQSAA